MNPSKTRPLTVLVTHGEPLVAQGLASVLAQHSDFEVHYKAPPPGSTVDVLVTDYRQGMLWLWQLAPCETQEAGYVVPFSPGADKALRGLERWLEPQLAEGEPLA